MNRRVEADFMFAMVVLDSRGLAVGEPEWDWTLTIAAGRGCSYGRSEGSARIVASRKGGRYSGCMAAGDGRVLVEASSLSLGDEPVTGEFTAYLPDGRYSGGVRRVKVAVGPLGHLSCRGADGNVVLPVVLPVELVADGADGSASATTAAGFLPFDGVVGYDQLLLMPRDDYQSQVLPPMLQMAGADAATATETAADADEVSTAKVSAGIGIGGISIGGIGSIIPDEPRREPYPSGIYYVMQDNRFVEYEAEAPINEALRVIEATGDRGYNVETTVESTDMMTGLPAETKMLLANEDIIYRCGASLWHIREVTISYGSTSGRPFKRKLKQLVELVDTAETESIRNMTEVMVFDDTVSSLDAFDIHTDETGLTLTTMPSGVYYVEDVNRFVIVEEADVEFDGYDGWHVVDYSGQTALLQGYNSRRGREYVVADRCSFIEKRTGRMMMPSLAQGMKTSPVATAADLEAARTEIDSRAAEQVRQIQQQIEQLRMDLKPAWEKAGWSMSEFLERYAQAREAGTAAKFLEDVEYTAACWDRLGGVAKAGAFKNDTRLVYGPALTIGAMTNSLFMGCTALEEVAQLKVAEGVTARISLTDMFRDCPALRRVGRLEIDVAYMQSTFKNCTALEELDFTGIRKIDSVFELCRECRSLRVVRGFNAVDKSDCDRLGAMFMNCVNLIGDEDGTIRVDAPGAICHAYTTMYTKIREVHLNLDPNDRDLISLSPFAGMSELEVLETLHVGGNSSNFIDGKGGLRACPKLHTLRIVGLGKVETDSNGQVPVYDFSVGELRAWGGADDDPTVEGSSRHSLVQTLVADSFDRRAAGYGSDCTIKLYPEVLARLSETDIAAAAAKGIIITAG